jgi:chromosome segregation ATPase
MSFLGRNINLALVALILIVILVAVGTSVLYQKGLTQRTQDYENSSVSLGQCQTALDNYRTALAEKESKLNDTSQDIRKYDIIYEEKQAQLATSQQNLQDTQGKLNTMTLQKEQFKNLYGDALLNISQMQRTIGGLESSVTSLRADVRELEKEMDLCTCP